MVTVYAEFLDIEPEEYRRATEVTYLGMVWGTRAALKRMVPRNHGSMVQVCSALGYRGIPLQAPYCGAKHACKGFTESVITELLHHKSKVQVSMVQLARRQHDAVHLGPDQAAQADHPRAARSTSRRSPPMRSTTPRTTGAARSMSASPPC